MSYLSIYSSYDHTVVFLPCLRALVPSHRSLCSSPSFPFQLFTYIKKSALAEFRGYLPFCFFASIEVVNFLADSDKCFTEGLHFFFSHLDDIFINLRIFGNLICTQIWKSENSNRVGNLEFCGMARAKFCFDKKSFNLSVQTIVDIKNCSFIFREANQEPKQKRQTLSVC